MEEILTMQTLDINQYKTEYNSKLKGKFIRVCLDSKQYCFKILQIKEIAYLDANFEVATSKNKNGKTFYSVLYYNGKKIPVIDCIEETYSEQHPKSFLIIADVIGKGMIQHIGIKLNNISDIFQMVMSEICLQIN